MEKYIRFNNVDGEKLKEIVQSLSELGVSFDMFNYAVEAFFNKEAEYHLEMWEHANYHIKDKDLRNRILEKLETKFFDNSNLVISDDVLEVLTNECVKDCTCNEDEQ